MIWDDAGQVLDDGPLTGRTLPDEAIKKLIGGEMMSKVTAFITDGAEFTAISSAEFTYPDLFDYPSSQTAGRSTSPNWKE